MIAWVYFVYKAPKHQQWRVPMIVAFAFLCGMQIDSISTTAKLKSLEKAAVIHASAIHTNQQAIEKVMKLEIYRQTQEYMTTETDVTK